MNILVTGGAGFIGSHLCERLLYDGHRVICYDNFDPYYDPSLKKKNVSGLLSHPRFRLFTGDICEANRLHQAAGDGVTHIVHLAAKAGVRASFQDPHGYYRVNVDGTVSLMEAARAAGVPRVIVASSSSVYGDEDRLPFREEYSADRPLSPYAASKRAAELVTAVYAQQYGMDVVCLRFFTVYGPRQRPDMAIARWMRSVYGGVPIQVFGDGKQTRDFTYVSDIVDGIMAVLSHPERLGFQVCNLGGACPVTMIELIREIGEVTARQPLVEYSEPQQGDAVATSADIHKATTLFGYRPQVSLRSGLANCLKWVQHGHQPSDARV